MSVITVGAAQLGPMARADSRAAVVKRLIDHLCRSYKTTVFDFARHRRPEHDGLMVERAGAAPPP